VTAPQIIQEIEAAGGALALKGDRIAYDVPKAARGLVDVLRLHRDEVLQVLRERQDAAKHQISRWMAYRCALSKNPARLWGSQRSLYRDYVQWAQQGRQEPCSLEVFAAIMDEFFLREEDGWRGLCLMADYRASQGSRLINLRLATEVLQ
jgi:hypothetical protein